MIQLNNKTSLQIPEQLPEFIRDDVNYQTFVSFIEAYYAWLETAYTANSAIITANTTGQGASYGSKNILNYVDVDNTLDDFLAYFIDDFLPYVPEDALADKRKLLKISKQLYKTKGTEKSYKFLFRALYNSEAETYNTSDQILKASDGKWIVPRSIKINSLADEWLLVNNLRLLGESSKSYALVNYAKRVGTKTEIFISSLQKTLDPGEFLRVVDNNNLDVYYLNGELYFQNQGYSIPNNATLIREKLLGYVPSITINPNFRGLFYNPGDPVVVYSGLNPDISEPDRATAIVGATSNGSIGSLIVVNPSHGYRLPPNTTISIIGSGSGALAEVDLLDETKIVTLPLITPNTLGSVATVQLGNSTHPIVYTSFAGVYPGLANTNSTLINALTFNSINVAPIGSVDLISAGINYATLPTIVATSNYSTSNGATVGTNNLALLGILQPIQILNGGTNYGNSNTITINGGTGTGAYANVLVNAAGSIISANYVFSSGNTLYTGSNVYPLGGLGYSTEWMPSVIINSNTGSNASLVITGVMGSGATFSPTTDSIGSVSSITITNSGSDYISTANVSLRVADIAVSNVSVLSLPSSGEIIYQTSSANSNTVTFSSYVDSITKLSIASPFNPANDVYQIRTYDYTGTYSETANLRIVKTSTTLSLTPQISYINTVGVPTSIKVYGDGLARAEASFVGGIIVGTGKYLNNDGQISTYGLVLESKDYNNYTYVLSTEQAIKTYRELVLNLLHPAGMRLRGRVLLKTGEKFNFSGADTFQQGNTLARVAGAGAYAILNVTSLNVQSAASNSNSYSYLSYMFASGTGGNTILNITTSLTGSNNVIKLKNVTTSNIGNTIFANDWIKFSATNNINAYSVITSVDWQSNTIYMTDNVFLTFANVAYVSVAANSNVINITGMTGQYDGNFIDKTSSNNIISVGDRVSFNGQPYVTVTKVFANGNFSIDGFANPKLSPTGIDVKLLQASTGVNAAAVRNFSYTKIDGAYANTTYATAEYPAGTVVLRSLGDINNVGQNPSGDWITSSDSLDYLKWISAVYGTMSPNSRSWIENVMNPFMIANQLIYKDYIYGGETANATLTINKNANTQSVMIFGDVSYYNPGLVTENGYLVISENGDYLHIDL
jgi:hypothetical protein